MSWKDKFSRFMYGRYGVDQFSKFLLGLTFVLCIVSMFFRNSFGSMISNLVFLLIVYTYFRMFSKNIYKRAAENERFLKFTSKFRRRFNSEKNIAGQRKYYRFYRCPGCGQRIRVPKGRGRIQIRCPKCNEKFIRKS